MANYAVIQDNMVTNIIVADSKEIAEEVTGLACIEYAQENPAYIGWIYDSTTNGFVNPNAPIVEELSEEETTVTE